MTLVTAHGVIPYLGSHRPGLKDERKSERPCQAPKNLKRGRSYAPHSHSIQSDSKNANKLSLALNRWNRVPIGETFASALSFMARSACT
jgi:hypothetical protein